MLEHFEGTILIEFLRSTQERNVLDIPWIEFTEIPLQFTQVHSKLTWTPWSKDENFQDF